MTRNRKPKDVLIETASGLFQLRGYYGVGLNDIIEESGIPKGSLYHYFPNGKEELAVAAVNHSQEHVLLEIQDVFERVENPIHAIQELIYQLSDKFGDGHTLVGSPIGTIAGEKHSTSEPIRIACQLAFERWQSVYKEKLIEIGYSQTQSENLSTVLNALIEGGILLSLTKKSGKPLREIADQIPLLLMEK